MGFLLTEIRNVVLWLSCYDCFQGECADCDGIVPCPDGYSPMTPEPVIVDGNCTYTVTRLMVQEIPGCQQLCHKTLQVS